MLLIVIGCSVNDDSSKSTVGREVQMKLEELEQHKWLAVAKELNGEDPYQFLRAYSPGTDLLSCSASA